MRRRITKTTLSAVAAALATLALAPLAYGQATRTWVSGVGDDVNPCSRTAPCKTFAGAISKTAAGGQISVLDPGGFGAVTITKSMTIMSPNGWGSILAAGTNGIIVNAGVNDVVRIVGVDIHGAGTGLDGIRFVGGKALHVEKTNIYGFTDRGIEFVPTSGLNRRLYVRNSTVSNNGGVGILVGPVAPATGTASITNTESSDNFRGIVASGARVGVKGCETSGNSSAGLVATAGAHLTAESCLVEGNATGVSSLASSVVRLSNSTVVDNDTGLFTDATGGAILSRSNNTVENNGVNMSGPGISTYGPR